MYLTIYPYINKIYFVCGHRHVVEPNLDSSENTNGVEIKETTNKQRQLAVSLPNELWTSKLVRNIEPDFD